MAEHRNGRNAVERVAARIHKQSQQPGNPPLTRDQARKRAVDIAVRHDRNNGYRNNRR